MSGPPHDGARTGASDVSEGVSEPTCPQVIVTAILNAIMEVCRVPETGEYVVDP